MESSVEHSEREIFIIIEYENNLFTEIREFRTLKITGNFPEFKGTYLNGFPKQGGIYIWPNG